MTHHQSAPDTKALSERIIKQDPSIAHIKRSIISGDKRTAQQYLKALSELLKSPQHALKVYLEVVELSVSAVPTLINDLNNQIYPKMASEHSDLKSKTTKETATQLDQCILLLKHMYNGQANKQDYPNLNRTFSGLDLPKDQTARQLNRQLSQYLAEFQGNLAKFASKRVEFFQQFEDSSISESFDEDSRMDEIVYMDIMEIKAIRQRVEDPSVKLTEQTNGEYLLKLRTFLNLKTSSLSNELQNEFNKEKRWAKHFIDKNSEYLSRNNNNGSFSNSNAVIELSKDEESIEFPDSRPNFYKKPIATATRFSNSNGNSMSHDTANFVGRKDESQGQLSNGRQNNFTINELPLDESKFTENQSKRVPHYADSSLRQNVGSKLASKLESKYQNPQYDQFGSNIKKSAYGNDNDNDPSQKPPDAYSLGYSRNPAQQMSFKPSESRQSPIKPVDKPQVEDSLMIDQSTFTVNQSVPQEAINVKDLQGSPTKNEIFTSSNNGYSTSNNPFASQATRYRFPEDEIDIQKQKFKQTLQLKQQSMKSPFSKSFTPNKMSNTRLQMAQNDLDSDLIEQQGLVVNKYQKKDNLNNRPHINTESGQSRNLLYTEHARTQNNFQPDDSVRKQDRLTLQDLGYKTYENNNKSRGRYPGTAEHLMSPRSHAGNKKRLSELTSEKKERKKHAPKRHQLNGQPELYVTKPYSSHFEGYYDGKDFNHYKANCFQDEFTLYSSDDLLITCSLEKMPDSKLRTHLTYQVKRRESLRLSVLYKIPKCFRIEKVSKINRKFVLSDKLTHSFSLNIIEFPLEMCLMELSYRGESEVDNRVDGLHIPMPITAKNFVELILTSKEEWIENWERLNDDHQTHNSSGVVFRVGKTFELNRAVIEPNDFGRTLSKEFVSLGSIEGYSVEEFGCLCHYRDMNNLLFLIRVSIRVDHIITIEVLTEGDASVSEKDFMRYYLEVLAMLLAKYDI